MGSRIVKISAKRKEDFNGSINLKTNIKVVSAERVKDAKDIIKVRYGFEVDYGDLGKVELEGLLFLSSDPKTLKEIQKSTKGKRIDSKEAVFLSNIILQKASVRAFEIEEELGLPIHIKLPSLNLKG
ncbi:MAG: hypothetical protein BV456_10805 [Thermoplasmata archaeon M8B2D]|nr:MAG: hypothetical protein BV456_10805 [Thermoplasmata archaeon M8B2D]